MSENFENKLCPKCRVKCCKHIEDPDKKPLAIKSSFCLIDAPRSVKRAVPNQKELISRTWAFLQPPNVSGTISLIKQERIEKMHTLLTEPGIAPKKFNSHFEEELYIKVHPDRSITKIRSRTEIKLFHPSSSDEDEDRDYCCPKPCNPNPECCKKNEPPQTREVPPCEIKPVTSTPNLNYQFPGTSIKKCPKIYIHS